MHTQEQEELLDELHSIIDKGGSHDEYQRGVFETLQWILEGQDKPEIED